MNVDMVEWQHADTATRPELKGKYLPDEGELRARLVADRDKVAVAGASKRSLYFPNDFVRWDRRLGNSSPRESDRS